MAKRELSSTLKNLKFMQRAAQREEKSKKGEDIKPDGNFFSTGTLHGKCVVIMEGDPHPGAIKGRLSFQSFNPSIDKLNEEAANLSQPAASATCSNQNGKSSDGVNGYSGDEGGCLNIDGTNSDADGNCDLKRKQSEVVPAARYPNKSQRDVKGNQQPSPNSSRGTHKQQSKRERLDWSVLRPPKCQSKRE